VLALAGGAFVAIIGGFIQVEAKSARFAIRAGGGLAVFVLIYLLNPPHLLHLDRPSEGSSSTTPSVRDVFQINDTEVAEGSAEQTVVKDHSVNVQNSPGASIKLAQLSEDEEKAQGL